MRKTLLTLALCLSASAMYAADVVEAIVVRMRDQIVTNKVFGHELRPREDLTDKELRERYDREKEHYRLPERAKLREIVVLRPDGALSAEAAQKRAADVAQQARSGGDFAKLA